MSLSAASDLKGVFLRWIFASWMIVCLVTLRPKPGMIHQAILSQAVEVVLGEGGEWIGQQEPLGTL